MAALRAGKRRGAESNRARRRLQRRPEPPAAASHCVTTWRRGDRSHRLSRSLRRARPRRRCSTSSIAIVIGPTPPGTGVIAPATCATPAKSTSPQSLPARVAVHADVDHDRARLDHRRRQRVGAADGGDDDVGAARVLGEIGRAAVADGDGRVGLQQQQRHRLADGVAAADHDRVLAAQVDAGALDQRHAAPRRARAESRAGRRAAGRRSRSSSRRRPCAASIASITRCGAMCARQRHLHQDAVHAAIGVERGDAREQLGFAEVGRRRSPGSERMPASAQALILLRT